MTSNSTVIIEKRELIDKNAALTEEAQQTHENNLNQLNVSFILEMTIIKLFQLNSNFQLELIELKEKIKNDRKHLNFAEEIKEIKIFDQEKMELLSLVQDLKVRMK